MFCVDNIIPGWYSRARTKKQASRNEFPIDPITIRRPAETIGGENDRNKFSESEGTVRWELQSNTEQILRNLRKEKVRSDGHCEVIPNSQSNKSTERRYSPMGAAE